LFRIIRTKIKIRFIYGRGARENRMGHKKVGEKKRAKQMEERVRDRVWLTKVVGVG
jgi:hypothetical protein